MPYRFTRGVRLSEALISIRNLKVHFPVGGGLFKKDDLVKAVDGLDLDIYPGETLGLVGESGCGKSTTGRAILQLIQPTEGSICFDGQELTELTEDAIRPLRSDFQMIFQDPYASLNPRMKVGKTVAEPMQLHGIRAGETRRKLGQEELQARVVELLEVVGLDPAFVDRYPHELSGGQRQRVGIARALSMEPRFLVADEPVSALDVSVQAQVLNLMAELQERFSLTYLFVAHNLAVVRHVSDRVAVMYLGKIVELAPRDALYDDPRHPYTKALLSAVPELDPEHSSHSKRVELKGDVPSAMNPPSGCSFHPRCPLATELCAEEEPALGELEVGHHVSCHYPDGIVPQSSTG